jgi:hypothetical protein
MYCIVPDEAGQQDETALQGISLLQRKNITLNKVVPQRQNITPRVADTGDGTAAPGPVAGLPTPMMALGGSPPPPQYPTGRKRHGNHSKLPSIAIVVVRCNETLDWMQALPHMVPRALFQTPRVHLIEQCRHMHQAGIPKIPNISNLVVSYRKNTGMAVAGYLHHIINDYSQLADYTVFTESKQDTASICEWPQFLRVALSRGYAGIGHFYGSGSVSDALTLPSCRTKPGGDPTIVLHGFQPLGQSKTMNDQDPKVIFGNHFIVSRKAMHATPLSVFEEIYGCFESLPERARPPGLSKVQWEELIPGRAENGMWEHYGSRLFGFQNVDRQNITRVDKFRSCGNWNCCQHAALRQSLVQLGGKSSDAKVALLARKLLS